MLLALAPIAGHHIITWIVIGLIAGLIAGKLVGGGGMGFLRDTVTGIVGAVIGGILLHLFRGGSHASSSIIIEIVVAIVGAVILLLIEKSLFHRRGLRRA
ncbi:MAG: GlsB/YeaQ/YmgE family stress response membrane protein [Acidimicrobiales bacterium]|nr:MAG: GlsB/YeaQ/YmgE family stress response membrane protein [Acidimicrobiales bacterium]